MRKFIGISLTIIFAFAVLSNPIMAKKIGKIEEGVFTDNDHKFSMAIPDGWSSKIGSKSKIPLRLTLMEKSPTFPRQFLGGKEDYAQIPTIKVFVDACTTTVDKFIENLLDSKFKSDQKKYFLKHLKIISRNYEILKSGDMTFHANKAKILEVRQAYTLQIAERGSNRAIPINDFYSASILFTVRDGKIFAMYIVSEYKTFADYGSIWQDMINSLKFEEAEK